MAWFGFPADEPNEIVVKNGFGTGLIWRGMSYEEKQGYAMGVVDGILLAAGVDGPRSRLSWVGPCVVGMRSDQVVAMISREVEAQPGTWHLYTLHATAYRALLTACPQAK